MRVLSRDEARERVGAAYGIPAPTSDAADADLLAESLRRAASYLAPSRKATLLRAALRATEGIFQGGELRDAANTLLERLIAVGDLVEQATDGIREVYLGSPAMIRLSEETILLVGVRPYGQPLLSQAAGFALTHRNGLRYLALGVAYPALPVLSLETWIAAPSTTTPDALIGQYQRRIANSAQTGERPGLSVLDSSVSTLNYSVRWRAPVQEDEGLFVARREAEYGARTWSVCVLEHGQLVRFIDLPSTPGILRGRDEAWRLQAAIDASRANPQRLIIRESDSAHSILDFLGPVPSFATRYLEVLGESVPHAPGALFSIRVRSADVSAVQQFMQENLWLTSARGVAIA